jgi:GPH family glycoside/pentoside/hexuronide:cation symporter
MKADAQGAASGRLSIVEKVGFGLGDTASNILYQAWSFFLAKFYTDVYMLPAETASVLFLVTRVWDMVFDPTIGMIADRTHTRWGKFRPYLLWMAIPYGFLTYVMFITPNWGHSAKILYAYITYILATTLFTGINIPYSSLMAVMTPSAKERTVLSQYRFFFAFIGQMLVTALMLPLAKYLGADPSHPGYSAELGFSQALGYSRGMGVFAVIAVALFFITFATTRERVHPPAGQKSSFRQDLGDLAKNVPWIILFISAIFFLIHNVIRNGSMAYYFDYVARATKGTLLTLGLGPLRLEFDQTSIFLFFNTVGMIAGVLVTMPCVRAFGKKPLIVAITLLSAVIELLFFFLPPGNFTLLTAVNVLWAILAGATPVVLFAMYADVADYYEWKFKRRATGLVTSGIMFAIKFGIAIGGFLTLQLLAAFHYVPNQAQAPEAITGIKLLFSVIPAALSLVYGIILVFYPINEAKLLQIEADLKARKAAEPAVS